MYTVVMTITHYDLFAGIGGFSLALEEVFDGAAIRHIFCEWESFPTSVLKHHWPDGEFYGDIKDLVDHTEQQGLEGHGADKASEGRQEPGGPATEAVSGAGTVTDTGRQHGTQGRGGRLAAKAAERSQGIKQHEQPGFTIVTGGFPCQPFSHAGRRQGTTDDRYQWPNMFAVIRNTKPEWVIAENVRGLVTWNDGLVLETVCTDLESEGYEVQPFIIPAVAVGAPHRRDRLWIIGRNPQYAQHVGLNGAEDTQGIAQGGNSNTAGQDEPIQPERPDSLRQGDADSKGTEFDRFRSYPDWNRQWQEVAFATCDDSVDDGLSRLVDGVPMSRPKWRQNSLKAYGNGIVPEVAMNIMQAIKESI